MIFNPSAKITINDFRKLLLSKDVVNEIFLSEIYITDDGNSSKYFKIYSEFYKNKEIMMILITNYNSKVVEGIKCDEIISQLSKEYPKYISVFNTIIDILTLNKTVCYSINLSQYGGMIIYNDKKYKNKYIKYKNKYLKLKQLGNIYL